MSRLALGLILTSIPVYIATLTQPPYSGLWLLGVLLGRGGLAVQTRHTEKDKP
jgi:hypothetical protein